ncbi:MAG: gliding motility-associated ABC transporter substrate-binding protein GldG [Bacteroidota bacterium]
MKKKNNRKSDLLNLLLGLGIIVLLNTASNYLFARFDLTAEKRYTLDEGTRNMLGNLKDVVFVQVYLEGDFPQGYGGFKRLRDETRILLDEFRVWGGDNIEYEFIDPNENPDPAQRQKLAEQLMERGLLPFEVKSNNDDGSSSSLKLFPGAVVTYNSKKTVINLLSTRRGASEDVQLNNSVQELEYEFSNAIRKLQTNMRQRVAILQGHGELDSIYIADFTGALSEYYDLEFVTINDQLRALRDTMQQADQIRNKYAALIVARPDTAISDREQFIIDQFIMYGGRVLWMVDPVYTDLDSLAITGNTYGLPNQLGIEDLLFRYGARLNTDLVQDRYCTPIALNTAPPGSQPRIERRDWLFFPMIRPESNHPIVRNLDAIRTTFLSTVDTVETTSPVKKTILLTTSKESRVLNTPTRISLAMTRFQIDRRMLNKPNLPVAVLLEGKFDSYFKSKFLPEEFKNSPIIGFKDESKETRMIIIGDGEIAANDVRQGQALPLGFDRNMPQNSTLYANKEFLLNCMNYLLDGKELLSLRSREVKLRLLDRDSIRVHREKWQYINVAVPVLVVIAFGVLRMFLRRRRYAGQKPSAEPKTS